MKGDLGDILAFLRVVDAGSFTAAGKLMGHPTSTMSRRVARLEAALGARLLQRTTRRLSLTEPGRLYYEQASQALVSLEDAENLLAQSQSHPRGRVRAVAPAEFRFTLDLAVDFLRANPDVRLDLEFTNRPVNLIEEGFDVAIQPGTLTTSTTLIAQKLAESHFHLVASPSYLAARGQPTTASELSQHEAIFFGIRGSNANWLLQTPKSQPIQVPLRSRLAVNNLHAARRAALMGLGIAMLPKIVCDEDIKSGLLVPVLPRVCRSVPLWLLYPGGRHLAPAVRAFIDFAKVTFKELFTEK